MFNNIDIEKVKKEKSQIQNTIREKIVGYILVALGLVAALAWNDAVKSAIEYFFPMNKADLWPKFIYAFILTIAIAILAYYISKIFLREKTDK